MRSTATSAAPLLIINLQGRCDEGSMAESQGVNAFYFLFLDCKFL